MALSGSQLTHAGGLAPHVAYAGFTAKALALVDQGDILYLSKETDTVVLSKELDLIYLSGENDKVVLSK